MTFLESFITLLHRGEDFRPSMLMDIYGWGLGGVCIVLVVFFALLFTLRERFNVKRWGRVFIGLGAATFVTPMLIIMLDSDFSKDYYSCVTDIENLETRGNDLEIKITTCRYRIVGTNDWSDKVTVGSKMVVK